MVEVQAATDAAPAAAPYLAILLTSDGGWAATDRELAEHVAAMGVPVAAWNSLRYYGRRRAPAEAAADLARLIEHYTRAWHRPRVLLVGYSFGADVLPLLVSALPADARRHVAGIALLGFSHDAIFEFHLVAWLGINHARRHYPTVPVLRRIDDLPITCIYGAKESDSACPDVRRRNVAVYRFPGGHHFALRNDLLAWVVLRTVGLGPLAGGDGATAGAGR